MATVMATTSMATTTMATTSSRKFPDRCVAGLATMALVVVGCTAALPLSRAEAQTAWKGTTTTDWNTPTNWSNGVPTGGAETTIDGAAIVLLSAPPAGTTNDLTVGNTNPGPGSSKTELDVFAGGALSSANGTIGANAGSVGVVKVDGAGSNWTINGLLELGQVGAGTLTISNGGKVSSGSNFIGDLAASTGTATVDGAGSRWTMTGGSVLVGNFGTGTLTISNGGTVGSATALIGENTGSKGTVTVDGTGSRWTTTGNIFVGDLGAGTLTISNGGTVTSPNGEIAAAPGSTGKVTVGGAGSEGAVAGALTVGGSGAGTLTLANGGAVSAGAFSIARSIGSTGTLNIGAAAGQTAVAPGTLNTPTVQFGAGTGTIVFNHNSGGYSFAPQIAGPGSVVILAGSTDLTAANT